jgi:secreted PhoX family phosphatase
MKNSSRFANGIGETFEELLTRRIARRTLLKGALAIPVVSFTSSFLNLRSGRAAEVDQLQFQPISLNTDDRMTVPPGYTAQVLLRWGDPILTGAPEFDLNNQSAAAQARQFGYNCDFVAFFPLGRSSGDESRRGILAVNHEYTNPELMFTDYNPDAPKKTQVDVEIVAHGLAFVEIEFARSTWAPIRNSRNNRRITGETLMEITGPAAGNDLLKASYDPTGRKVRGTLNNCGGGVTPWGTLLTAEENFNQYFANRNSLPDSDARKTIADSISQKIPTSRSASAGW